MNSSNTSTQHWSLWRKLLVLFVVAVLLNYIWEMAQTPLYEGMDFNKIEVWWHCFMASLGDGVDVLIIFAAGWILLRRQDWFEKPSVRGYALILIMGLAISISIELYAVYVLERWKYSSLMPLMPGLGVGLSPVAQMVVLPAITFRIVAWRKKAQVQYRHDRN